MIIKTLRDLKNMLNTINDEKVLDKELRYCYEDNGGGVCCDGAWFDLQTWGYGSIEDIVFPTITVCNTEESMICHEGRTPWTELSDWIKAEED